MSISFDHLPAPVAKALRAYYGRKRLYEWCRVWVGTGLIYAFLVLVATHCDRFLFLSVDLRVAMMYAVHAAAALLLLLGMVACFLRRHSEERITYEFEGMLPKDVAERYVTLADFRRRGDGGEGNELRQDLLQQLEQETLRHSESVTGGRLAQDRRLRWLVCWAAGGIAIFAGLMAPKSYEFGLMCQRFYQPWDNLPKPSFVKIDVKPEVVVVGKGGEVVIQAEIRGEVPAVLATPMKWAGMTMSQCVIATADGLHVRHIPFEPGKADNMSRIQRRLFLYVRSDLQDSFSFRIRCADAETDVRRAEVVAQPQITSVSVSVQPPEYTKLAAQTLDAPSGAIRAYADSQMTVAFTSDQAVPTVEVLLGPQKKPVTPTWDADTRRASYEFTLKEALQLELRVTNDRGFANVERHRLNFAILEDQSPTVRLESPTGEVNKVPGELVPIRAALEDDLGIVECAIRYQLNPSLDPDAQIQDLPLELPAADAKSLVLNTPFDLDKTGVVPGDELQVQLRVRDTAGNDGISQPLTIRVVAFTRGENERQRLAALSVLTDGIRMMAEKPGDGQGEAINDDIYEKIKALASSNGVVIEADNPSLVSLLELMQREHHFTDAAQHQDDLRMLHAVLHAIFQPPQPAEDPAAFRTQKLQELAGLTGKLTQARRLKNLTWRMFGMTYEAQDIHGKLKALAAMEEVDEDQKRSIRRRAKLYLTTLQDVGDVLIQIAQETPGLDEKAILDAQGDLNTAAYYLKRGSLKRNISSCRKVIKRLKQLLALLPPAFPKALQAETEARKALTNWYAGNLQTAATEALTTDFRMMGFSPFTSLPDRIRVFALLRASQTSASEAERTAAQFVVAPSADLQQAIRQQKVVTSRLAAAWERGQLYDHPRIGPGELALAERLIELELLLAEAILSPNDAALADAIKQRSEDIQNMDLAATSFAPSKGTRNATTALGDRHTYIKRITAAVPLQTTEAILAELQQAFAGEDAATQLAVAAQSGDLEAVAKIANQAQQRLQGEFQTLDLALGEMGLRIGFVYPMDEQATKDEVVFLQLRREQSRYRVRGMRGFAAVTELSGKTPSADDLSRLNAELPALIAARNQIAQRLDTILSNYREGKTQEAREKFPLLQLYDETRAYLQSSVSFLNTDDKATVASAFMERFPGAQADFLRAQLPLLQKSAAALEQADTVLKDNSDDQKAFASAIAEAEATLQAFGQALERLTTVSDEIGRQLATVRSQLQQLKPGGEWTDVQIRQRMFLMAETKKNTAQLQRSAGDIAVADQQSGEGFRGGPPDIWTEPFRHDADHRRRQLVRLARFARSAAGQAMLEALQANPDSTRYAESWAWSQVRHAMVRSALSGAVRTRPKRVRKGGGADKLVDWLTAELAEARKEVNRKDALRHYPRITKEYLDSVADFLRY